MNITNIPQIVQTPVITLPGVNVTDVANKYKNGHYEKLLLACTGGQQVVVSTNQVFKSIQGGNIDDAGYVHTKRNGVEITFVTVNQDLYEDV